MKKKWVIPVIAAVILAIAVGVVLFHLSGKDGDGSMSGERGYSTGRYIRTENGMDMIIIDGSPIVMSSDVDNLFTLLQTGDKIRIRHGLIRETYPGGTDVYECERIAEGSMEDIPQDILESICPMGYTPVDDMGVARAVYTGKVTECTEEGFVLNASSLFDQTWEISVSEDTVCTYRDGLSAGDTVQVECCKKDGALMAVSVMELQNVSYEYGYANMSVVLPGNWEYEIREYSEDAFSFGISFRPEGMEGWVSVLYCPEAFGVCGTGLVQQQIRLDSGLKAYKGTYDSQKYWSYITVEGLPGTYVFQTENVRAWSQEQFEQAEQILQAASLAQGLMWENSALESAKRECGEECYVLRATFDFCTGEWTVFAQDGDTEYILGYSAEGKLLYKEDSSLEIAVPEKPVIYLYPEKEEQITVELDFDGTVTSTYPKYYDGWKVIAQPDGTLTDPETGRSYYCLFWEGVADTQYDFSEGFVVAGEDTADFLEDALAKLGLTQKEANEFIIYWAPRMENNDYNLISFQTEAYTDSAVLNIEPKPDTLIRVFMAWKALEEPVEIAPQELTAPRREGFTVVEWGGAEVAQ